MATITSLGSSFNTTAGNKTVTATPAVDDLIVIVVMNSSADPPPSPSISDNNSGGGDTYTEIASFYENTTARRVSIWIRDNLITSATSTVFTLAITGDTGGGLEVLKATSMTKTGTTAARQSAGQNSVSAGGTPAPVFPSAVLTGNPVIGALGNATNPAGVTQRTGYTEVRDTGYATPTSGVEIMTRDSGETSDTMTWGSTTATAASVIVVELDTSAPSGAFTGWGIPIF